MPKQNPKWNKKRIQHQYDKKIGVQSEESAKCQVEGCGKRKKRVVSMNELTDHLKKLNWTLATDKKARKVSLCKDHYKEFSKYTKKDEESKYKKMRDYGSP